MYAYNNAYNDDDNNNNNNNSNNDINNNNNSNNNNNNASDYRRVKTIKPLILGKSPHKDQGVKMKGLGWTLPGTSVKSNSDVFKEFFLSSGQDQMEKMCSLEILEQNEN